MTALAAPPGPGSRAPVLRELLVRGPVSRALYRAAVGVTGSATVLVGLVLVPLPGPGWLVVAAGTALLATEFERAAAPARGLRTVLRAATAGRLRAGAFAALAVVATVLPLRLL